MSFLVWVLVAYFALSGVLSLASLTVRAAKPAKTAVDGVVITFSILLTAALYTWLIWAVIQLATK